MIPRHKTALGRADYSKPIRLALQDAIITPTTTVLDYGCGRGSDVARLAAGGFHCRGWDPEHANESPPTSADVVNLGYVINVIEDVGERGEALRRAWTLTQSVLVVTARMSHETIGQVLSAYGDGYLTSRGTFQKFYDHIDLRDWIAKTIEAIPVAAAPGMFYVFRDDGARASFLASRQRRVAPTLHAKRPDVLLERHKAEFDALLPFFSRRGRLPSVDEVPQAGALYRAVAGLDALLEAVRVAVGAGEFDALVEARREDILLYLALAKFEGRPTLRCLPIDLQLDVRSFFPSYPVACRAADRLLLAVGKPTALAQAFSQATVGKLTGNALYAHVTAVKSLPVLLRAYEGCARACVGAVEEATLVKLHRLKAQISYLTYPEFDRQAHPALLGSLIVRLHDQQVRYLDFSRSTDPPVLHRKELFVDAQYPRRSTFERLTQNEECLGLLDAAAQIGTRDGWERRLTTLQYQIVGHQVQRRTDSRTH